MAASLTLPRHNLPSLLPTQTPKTPSTQSLSIVFKSSQSQFHGLRFAFSSILPIPSSSFASTSISAKVNKGQVPPSFTLKDQEGRNVSLSKFKWRPVDETPGCTKQACAFRDSYEKFKKAGAEVVGISGDDSSSHKHLTEPQFQVKPAGVSVAEAMGKLEGMDSTDWERLWPQLVQGFKDLSNRLKT